MAAIATMRIVAYCAVAAAYSFLASASWSSPSASMPFFTGSYSGRTLSVTRRSASLRSVLRSAAVAGMSPSCTKRLRSSAKVRASACSSTVILVAIIACQSLSIAAMLASTVAVLVVIMPAVGLTMAAFRARRLAITIDLMSPSCAVGIVRSSYTDCSAALELAMPNRPRPPMAISSKDRAPINIARRVETFRLFMMVCGWKRARA